MAQSGWYDDPDGTPGRLRFWDGVQWTDATRPTPGQQPANTAPDQPTGPQPVPTGLPPQPTGFPAQPGFIPTATSTATPAAPAALSTTPPPTTPPPTRSRRGWLGLAAGGVALAVVLAVASTLLGGNPVAPTTGAPTAATPGVSAAPRTALPTTFPPVTNPPVSAPTLQPASPGSSVSVFPTMPDCPLPTATTISDGALTVTFPSAWSTHEGLAPWASACNASALGDVTAGWAMGVTVGTVDDAADDLAATAQLVWQATVTDTNSYPTDLQPKADITTQQAVTVQGLSGYRITGEVRVTGVTGVEGDVLTVLVLRAANGGQHAVVALHTIGDAAGAATVAAIVASVRVSG